MKILITGVAGFAAKHFLHYLSKVEPGSEIMGIYNDTFPAFEDERFETLQISLLKINLLDKNKITKAVLDFNPEYILHLAGRSSVAKSWKEPADSIMDNTSFFLNIVEAVRILKLNCRILSVGSTEEYGNANAGLPLKETDCPEPASPYGVARILQQKLVKIYAESYGVDIVHTRSFNHIGAHQKPEYVISSFAKQIVQQAKKGYSKIELVTGDINVIRDFSDVRDVVRAYYLLLYKAVKGQTYNVCSGKGYLIKDMIDLFSNIIGEHIYYTTNEKNFRPSENKVIIGSFDKLKNATGWEPEYSIEESLRDIIKYWEMSL